MNEDKNGDKIHELVDIDKQRKSLEKQLEDKLKSTDSPFKDVYLSKIEEHNRNIPSGLERLFDEDELFDMQYEITKSQIDTAISIYKRALQKLSEIKEFKLMRILRSIVRERLSK